MFLYFLAHPGYYSKGSVSEGTFDIAKKKLLADCAIWGGSVILILFRRRISALLEKRARLLSLLLTLITPVITFYATNFIVRSIPINFRKQTIILTPKIILLNVLIVAVILLLLLFITNNMRAASVLCLFSGVVFSMANYYVCIFRDVPIVASDFASFGTAMDVAGSYSYTPNFHCLFALQAALGFLLLFRCLGNSRLFALRGRLIFSAASIAAFVIFAQGFLFSDFLENQGIELHMFKPLISYFKCGTYVTMVRSFQYMQVEEPEGYSTEQVEAITADYESDSAQDADVRPNILVIIDEAFSDLAVLGDLTTNEDYMPFFHSLQETSTHGWAYASVYGGNTANTEYEVLTGNSILPLPQNAIAFQLYVKSNMPALASLCGSLGYENLYAMHPFRAGNYSRPSVYSYFGFETYFSETDFSEDTPTLREYISDMAVTDMIIEKYEEKQGVTDEPFLFYTMTMQNHGPYNKSDYDAYHNGIVLEDPEDEPAQRYLNLIKHTDSALKALVEYFEQVDEPTVILFLGDHQPNSTNAFLKGVTDGAYQDWSDEDSMKKYAIPFVLWSNYGLEAREYEKTSMNYLQSILFDLCGLPMTGYQKYLLELMDSIPALTANGYWGADGNFYAPKDTSSPYYEKLTDYLLLLYNNVFDSKNRPEEFYELK
ncbi:MAG: LTA synthase family protein [Eubacteriales bacterium]|nr:LTA synthase family protein [Eubacteriales bacterium]